VRTQGTAKRAAQANVPYKAPAAGGILGRLGGKATGQGTKILVANLAHDITSLDVKELFGTVGQASASAGQGSMMQRVDLNVNVWRGFWRCDLHEHSHTPRICAASSHPRHRPPTPRSFARGLLVARIAYVPGRARPCRCCRRS